MAVLAQTDTAGELLRWAPTIVGILSAVAALIVALVTRSTAREQIRISQLLAQQQMAASRDLSTAQITATKEAAVTQLRANLIAASRRDWIERLRTRITELFSIANHIHDLMSTGAVLNPADWREFWERRTYIELMLNPNEAAHVEFVAAMTRFTLICTSGDDRGSVENWGKARDELFAHAKTILKAEWEKVKTLS